MKHNEENLGLNLKLCSPLYGEFYRVDTELCKSCADALDNVITKLPFQDFTNFKVLMSRADSSQWNDFPRSIINVQSFLQNKMKIESKNISLNNNNENTTSTTTINNNNNISSNNNSNQTNLITNENPLVHVQHILTKPIDIEAHVLKDFHL